jgi:hypothetical protein
MPTISRFYGILIRMYFFDAEQDCIATNWRPHGKWR